MTVWPFSGSGEQRRTASSNAAPAAVSRVGTDTGAQLACPMATPEFGTGVDGEVLAARPLWRPQRDPVTGAWGRERSLGPSSRPGESAAVIDVVVVDELLEQTPDSAPVPPRRQKSAPSPARKVRGVPRRRSARARRRWGVQQRDLRSAWFAAACGAALLFVGLAFSIGTRAVGPSLQVSGVVEPEASVRLAGFSAPALRLAAEPATRSIATRIAFPAAGDVQGLRVAPVSRNIPGPHSLAVAAGRDPRPAEALDVAAASMDPEPSEGLEAKVVPPLPRLAERDQIGRLIATLSSAGSAPGRPPVASAPTATLTAQASDARRELPSASIPGPPAPPATGEPASGITIARTPSGIQTLPPAAIAEGPSKSLRGSVPPEGTIAQPAMALGAPPTLDQQARAGRPAEPAPATVPPPWSHDALAADR
ncbi:MAG: hypothetical protein ACFCUN_12510 [Hyphomicrobiaceae bacterium]